MVTDLKQLTPIDKSAGRCEIRGQGSHRHGTAIARDRHDHLGPCFPIPLCQDLEAPLADLSGHLGIRSIWGEERPKGLTLSEVGQTRDRTPLLGELFRRDPTPERNPDVREAAGPGAARFDRQADLVEVPGRDLALFVGDLGGEPHTGAVVAAAARLRIGIVELTDEELHSALPGRLIIEHGLGLFRSDGRDLLISFPVIGPPVPGRDVPALDLRHRIFDFESLEQQIQSGSLGSDQRLQAGHG